MIIGEYQSQNYFSPHAGDRANDQLRVYGYRSNYKKVPIIIYCMLQIVTIYRVSILLSFQHADVAYFWKSLLCGSYTV